MIEKFFIQFQTLSVLNAHEYQIILSMKECKLYKYV
jgi:hypothetical protein